MKFGDEFVLKFGDKFGESPTLGTKMFPNLRDKSVPNKLGNLYAESGIQIVGHSTIAFV